MSFVLNLVKYVSKIFFRYKCDKNTAMINMEAGSTVPLVDSPNQDAEVDDDYNPFEHRKLTHPTS